MIQDAALLRPMPPASQRGTLRRWLIPMLAAAIAAGSALAASGLGGGQVSGTLLALVVVTGASMAGALSAWSQRSGQRAGAAGTGAPADGSNAPAGTGLLARQVLPVWRRHLEATRSEAESGVGGLLESFNQLSSGLSAAVDAASQGPSGLGAGAADDLVDANLTLIEDVLGPVSGLLDARAQTQVELEQIAAQMLSLTHAGKELDSLSRHARLVAMNASIEANRAGQSQGGFGAVAREVLDVSQRAGATAQELLTGFSDAERRLSAMRRRIELDTGNHETLQMELRQAARRLVTTLVGDMSQSLAGTRELRASSEQLQSSLEGVFMGFQFQDRFTQMLGTVQADIERFEAWLTEGRDATRADAEAWLRRLDDSYTMEQQRSHHHGTVEIERAPAVEFF